MDLQVLKEKIENLDPGLHRTLRDNLIAKYNRKTGETEEVLSKDELISDPFAEIFKRAVDDLNSQYVEGTTDYVRKHHPDFYRKTREAEDRLNEVWKAGLEGKATLEEFSIVLGEWVSLHIEAITIYKKETDVDCIEETVGG